MILENNAIPKPNPEGITCFPQSYDAPLDVGQIIFVLCVETDNTIVITQLNLSQIPKGCYDSRIVIDVE